MFCSRVFGYARKSMWQKMNPNRAKSCNEKAEVIEQSHPLILYKKCIPSGNQTWLAGKWTIEIGYSPSWTSICRGFSSPCLMKSEAIIHSIISFISQYPLLNTIIHSISEFPSHCFHGNFTQSSTFTVRIFMVFHSEMATFPAWWCREACCQERLRVWGMWP